jgi:hypothetical protein
MRETRWERRSRGRRGFSAISLRPVLGFLLAACLSFPSAAGAAARRPLVRLTGNIPQPVYFHDYSTDQIEALSGRWVPSRASREPGLTWFEHELKHEYQIRGISRGPGRPLEVWVDSLDVDFSITKMNVYVSSQYAVGTCQYKVILAHENTHVAINERVYRKYRALLSRILRKNNGLPTRSRPLKVGSMEEAKRVMEDRLRGILDPFYERFKREVVRENAKIDTPANYRRTQAQCRGW